MRPGGAYHADVLDCNRFVPTDPATILPSYFSARSSDGVAWTWTLPSSELLIPTVKKVSNFCAVDGLGEYGKLDAGFLVRIPGTERRVGLESL